ncbi:glutamate--tRNA ligase [Patescibacteria group bacterium]|nr:glutamate--tRNA ligase [Patescibacteria group bacterium]
MSPVVTRFAPSPTGLLHAGNYRTAVFAYLFAKHSDGKFIVRIEDTDAARSKPEYEANIREALAWLGLPADETYRQSEHRARHRELLEQLIASGAAYVSKETPQAPGDREEVVRFRNPGGALSFTDVIRGRITTDVADLGDFIIARSLDEPVFHFAVVVDDADERVSHVIRGGDHISNTARQMLIQRALDFPEPLYAHLPLIMDRTHKKLSKRTGAKALTEYRDLGILPEALLNYLAFLGWNPGDRREYMTLEELVRAFELSRVQKGSAVFDEVKLFSVNQHWMRQLSIDAYIERGKFDEYPPDMVRKIVPLLQERARTFSEAREMLSGEFSCFFRTPSPDRAKLLAKEPPDRPGLARIALKTLLAAVEALPGEVSAETVKQALMPFADAEEAKGKGGRGSVLWPLRYALSGQERSPDPFTLIALLGARESSARIQNAIAILGE